MKFVSKFQLGLPLAWRGCVAPGRGIFLGLGLLFPIWIKMETQLFSSNFRRDDPCRKS
jgi:hypothetical protein